MTTPATQTPDWQQSLTDPAADRLPAADWASFAEAVLGLYPRPQAEPAFDPAAIAAAADRLRTRPAIATGQPLLDRAIRVGLAHIDATFRGDHPKYGVKGYAQDCHDGFPPTIIAAVDALSAWGLAERAAQLFGYWLATFVGDDGRLRYYGPSVSEYGQLLHTAVLLAERAPAVAAAWLPAGQAALDRMAALLLDLQATAQRTDGLLPGTPEADERDQPGRYFHNSAWAATGLRRWASLCELRTLTPRATTVDGLRQAADRLTADTLAAIRRTWPTDPDDWWLPPQAEPLPRPASLTATRVASYTNYRYWPELLASDVLPPDLATRLVRARQRGGGQFCGLTRFMGWLDDWPLADYLAGLHRLGRHRDLRLSLLGHVAYHQAEGHLTAYEQVTLPPGTEKAPYCLPCQLVAVRAGRWLAG